MQKKRVLTINDFQRLTGYIEFASLRTSMPSLALRLQNELLDSTLLPQENISGSIITMNSRVLLKEVLTNRDAELTLTYPQDVDARERKVSVFSSIGIALIGKQVGDVVSWKTPVGLREFEILKVTYQPEAVGHYSL